MHIFKWECYIGVRTECNTLVQSETILNVSDAHFVIKKDCGMLIAKWKNDVCNDFQGLCAI